MSKNILVGVTGGIAAYKSANIISKLKKRGYNIKVIMTKSATEIITPLTLETLARDRVVVDMWEKKSNYDVEHISMADWADFFLIAPATYNIVGKIANGIADDMLSTVVSATSSPVYFALAMNVHMYENPILWDNIEKLKKYGKYYFIDSDEGFLACNYNAKGRLKDEEEIVKIVDNYFERKESLKGKKILLTAGRTEEKIDPIRYLSNKSTGKMGYALAEAAKNLGAEVTLVAGPNNQKDVEGIEIIKVTDANEMYKECVKRFDNINVFIGTAAVADYRAKNVSKHKIKKSDGNLIIELERNPDIILELGKKKKNQFIIGFCAESENLVENAKSKLSRKNMDIIVANSVENFGSDNNTVIIINKKEEMFKKETMDKKLLAYEILSYIR